MNAKDEDRIKQLLQQALPPIDADPEPARDLWPAMQQRLQTRPAAPTLFSWATLDWALLAGLVAFVAIFPASIPMLLYCL
jgi:anti-sigma factor RsiW